MKKPLILVTNDDGVHAAGLKELYTVMKNFGDVVVVAPMEAHSGMGHAVTVRSPLRLKEFVKEPGFEVYGCSGTPVDAVKMGEQVVLKRKPDLLVSGINHGSNSSVNVVYSGTMAAVIEGAINGITSIGFSLTDYSANADFSACEKYVTRIAGSVLSNGLAPGICLNVNIPAVEADKIMGVKVCKQGKGQWVEEFDKRIDPHNRSYYWLTGSFKSFENGRDTDEWALANNYVSVVPMQFDLTAHQSLDIIKNWDLDV